MAVQNGGEGPVPGMAVHDCSCGRRYVMAKNGTIREAGDAKGDVLVLDGDHGEPVYAVPRQAASYLGLGERPRVYYHNMGGEGGSVMATRDVHPPEVLRYVAMLLDPGRRDALLGHLGRTGS